MTASNKDTNAPVAGRPRTFGSERLSAVVSFAYLAHCLLHVLAPIALGLMPWLFSTSREAVLPHKAVVATLLVMSSVILTVGQRRHGHWRVPICGSVGFALMIGPLLLGRDHGHAAAHAPHHVEYARLILSTMGSLLLSWAHWDNYRLGQALRQSAARAS